MKLPIIVANNLCYKFLKSNYKLNAENDDLKIIIVIKQVAYI